MNRLKDRVAVITGSSSGIGRAIAIQYAQEGANIVCADLQPASRAEIDKGSAASTDEHIRSLGGRAIFVKTDVSKAEEMEQLIEKTVEEYGRIDILVNNAGVAMKAENGPPPRIHETSEAHWDITMAVNAKSIFLGSKYAIVQMLKQEPLATGDRGWIINIASVLGLVGSYRAASYCASKGAVASLTRQVAIDYAGDRIHCNAICPGFISTQMVTDTVGGSDQFLQRVSQLQPLGGLGQPTDIAGAAVFLASDDARFMTGVCMPVDGGYTAQ
ncbi:hypothetical protein NLG97_g5008 [Lecanicillium saksenae]|uniref:Uncharacterized protein n=1 Tax=Lecanicillium saksenae TaxID=468837 RepID=A0ACC1QTN3_9HYPO|nr:hypothetical protein NLG97_g5008 [Lecanicillium saksenae]